MAQPIQVSPIQVSSGDGLEYLGQSINALVKAKEAREKALRDAVLKQQENNYKIFGDSNELLRKYNDSASSTPIEQRDAIFNQGVKLLSQYANSPNYAQIANQVVAGAYQSYTGWNDYYKKSDEAAKELSTKYGMDEKTIKAFAYRNAHDPKTGLPKDPSSFGDVYSLINSEVTSHPELYVDQYKLTNGAYKDLDNVTGKPQKKGDKLTIGDDNKVKNIGTDYTVTLFDKEEQFVDPVTGLKYSKPVLDEQPYTGGVTNPKGGTYKVLSDDKFDLLTKSESPMIKQKLMIGAIDKIRDHNAEIFKKAGLKNPDELALSVSKNNVSSFENIKGFVNPFDESNMDLFQRVYAADFIKASGRYKPDGSVIEFKMDRGNKPEKSKQTINVLVGPGMEKGYIDAYSQVEDVLASGAAKPLNELDQNIRTAILKIADESTVFRAGKKGKVIPEAITIGKDSQGRSRIYMSGPDGKPVGGGILFSAQSLNQKVNEGLSMKTQERATAESKPLQQQTKKYKGLDKDGNPIFD